MKKSISIIIMILFVIFSLTIISNAGYVSNDPTVTSGESISITVRSSENLQNFDLKLTSYAGLTYTGCSNPSDAAIVNSSNGSISYATAGNGTTTLGTYTFTAPEVTQKTTYKVVFDANGTSNTSVVTVNPKSVPATETTQPTENNNNTQNTNNESSTTTQTKSNVATLSNLGIKPNDFKGFKTSTMKYSVEVPYETEKIEVYASKGHKGQTIEGTGTKTLKEGLNTLDVKVTAEDGKTTKTYTINVTRKAKAEEKVEEKPEEKPAEETEKNTEETEKTQIGLSDLKIKGIKIEPEFKSDVYEYKATLKEDLEKLDITTTAFSEKATVEVIGNENLSEGENIITIIVKDEKEENTVTYQIIVNKEKQEDTLLTTTQKNNKEKMIVLVVVAVLMIVIITISAILIVRDRRSRPVEYSPEFENIYDVYSEDLKEEKKKSKRRNEYEFNGYEEEYYDKPRRSDSKGKRFK